MQTDRGLPRAGGALHADAHAQIRPDDLVLLRLDRRDDVAHRPGAGPLDLAFQQFAGNRRGGVGEGLVLEGHQLGAVVAEPPAAPQAHRVRRVRTVERAGDIGAPIDHQWVVTGHLAHEPATEIDALPRNLRGVRRVVHPREEQRRRLVVLGEGGQATFPVLAQVRVRHLIHHRVTADDLYLLDLPAHVPQGEPAPMQVLPLALQLRIAVARTHQHPNRYQVKILTRKDYR